MEKKKLYDKINLKEIKCRPLTNKDISNCLYNESQNKFTLYKDLYNCENIINLFDNDDKIILLLPVSSHVDGHWINLLLNKKTKTINYNDSYGLQPEHFKQWLSPEKIDELGIEQNVLDMLLHTAINDGYKVKVNKTRYQQYNNKTNNCGRHVVLRVMLKALSNTAYNKLLKSTATSYDDAVCLITYNIIGS